MSLIIFEKKIRFLFAKIVSVDEHIDLKINNINQFSKPEEINDGLSKNQFKLPLFDWVNAELESKVHGYMIITIDKEYKYLHSIKIDKFYVDYIFKLACLSLSFELIGKFVIIDLE